MDPYRVGHVKHDTSTGAVAVRTIFHREIFPDMYWIVATTGSGGRFYDAAHCEDWDDLYTPPSE